MITPRFILLTLARSFAVAVLAYALGFLLPKQYSSDMALYFPSAQQKASGGLAALAGGAAGGDADGGSIPVLQNAASSPLVGSGPASATGIMTSRTCLFEVIQKLDLQTKWGMSNKWNAYNRLARAIGIRTDKNGFLKVECTEEDPELCKSIVDAVRAHLDKRASQLTLNVAKKNRELVEQQIKKADDEVARVTTKMEAALAQGPVGSLDIVGKNYLDIQTKLIDSKALAKSAEESIASQEQSLKRIYGAAGSKDPTALESAGVEASKAMGVLAEELQKRRIEMSDTARKFTQGSPEYKAASRRLRDVESVADQEMRKQTESIGAGTNTKLVAAKAQLIALKASQAEYEKFAAKFDQKLRDMPEQYAKLQITQAEFTGVLQRKSLLQQDYVRALLAEQRDPSRYEVVDAAEANPDPVAPRKGMLAAIFFVLAIGVQILLVSVKRDEKVTLG